jgi:hypothetical protein
MNTFSEMILERGQMEDRRQCEENVKIILGMLQKWGVYADGLCACPLAGFCINDTAPLCSSTELCV